VLKNSGYFFFLRGEWLSLAIGTREVPAYPGTRLSILLACGQIRRLRLILSALE